MTNRITEKRMEVIREIEMAYGPTTIGVLLEEIEAMKADYSALRLFSETQVIKLQEYVSKLRTELYDAAEVICSEFCHSGAHSLMCTRPRNALKTMGGEGR